MPTFTTGICCRSHQDCRCGCRGPHFCGCEPVVRGFGHPPASTKQGGEWSPPPELTLPTPRPVRITSQGIFIRVCGAIIVSFLLTISECPRALSPSRTAAVGEADILAEHLRLHAADIFAAGFHLFRGEFEDAKAVETQGKERLPEIGSEEFERAAPLFVAGVVALNDEILVPLIELRRLGFCGRDRKSTRLNSSH